MAMEKKGLAAIIALAKPKSSDSSGDISQSDEEDDDEGYSAAVDELADTMDVPDDKREAFMDAFKAAVMACK